MKLQSKIILSVILFFCIFRSFYFEGIATKSLYDFDEARYAEIAKNIIRTNNWLIPLASGPDDPTNITVTQINNVNLHPYFWKPPLHTWIVALNYHLFGVSVLSVRLPSLIFALLSLILIYLIARLIFPNSSLAPLLSVAFISSTNDFSYISSQGIAEAQLMFFSLLSVYFLLKPAPPTGGSKYLILSALSLSFAFMTKSFAVFWIYPLALAILRYQKHLNFKNLILWTIPQILVILPWHLFMYFKFGDAFINNYVLVNTIGRGSGAQSNIAPVYWYIKYALWQWKTYLYILPLLILPFIKLFKKNYPQILLLTTWMLLIFLPFSLIRSKVWWYIFPFWTPFCIFIAYLINFYFHKFKKLTILSLILLLSATNYLTITQSRTRTDWNQGLKQLGLQYSNLTNLSVYKIPYESPLFYLNTIEISRKIDDNTKYIITNKDFYQELSADKWQVKAFSYGTYLLSRIN